MIPFSTLIIWIFFVCNCSSLSILTIENHEFGEHTVEDGWGEWSEWQPCSRSCGGGVTYMRRECGRNRTEDAESVTCVGSARMYTSCSIQDCPVNSEDFRSVQCGQRNNMTYNGRKHEWIPYLGESATNACELYCQPTDKSFFLRLEEKVIDGTRCQTDSLNVCVDGTCEAVGCDMLLGSDLKLDVCGECDGDGTSCSLVKSTVAGKLPSGYTPLVMIPPGATNVNVFEKKGTRNFLAVRDSNKNYVLNGHWQINSSSTIHVAGSALHYKRKSDKKRSPEGIIIKGPTTEMIYIDVLVQDRNRGIGYEFYIPRGMTDPNHGEHLWVTEEWKTCSAECGGGIQKRRVVCKNNGKRCLNYLCNVLDRPPVSRPCNEHPCEARWLSGNWTECSRTCGGGVQARSVNCVENENRPNQRPLLLSDHWCSQLSDKPASQRPCGSLQCGGWTTSQWSTCSSTCGYGSQIRSVTCPEQSICDSTSIPENERECNLGPCEGIEWTTTEWGECTNGCGNGKQTRRVTCAGKNGNSYPESICKASKRPSNAQDCFSDRSCPRRPDWLVEDWSKCSSVCGVGIQTRQVVCALYNVENYRILSDEQCPEGISGPKPALIRNCTSPECEVNWFSGPWSTCSESCGGGVRTRIVVCLSPGEKEIPSDSCDHLARPFNMENCNQILCPSSEDSGLPISLPAPNLDCQQTPFGCCPDGMTAASDPSGQSCGRPLCANSLYGCCPDGLTFSSGNNFEGCEKQQEPVISNVNPSAESTQGARDVLPESSHVSDICRQHPDPGPCREWTVIWFYDTRTGRCDRFWYGGCRGNQNRFYTVEGCTRTCGGSSQVDDETTPTASLPKLPDIYSPTTSTYPQTSTPPPRLQTDSGRESSTQRTNVISREPLFSPDFDVIPVVDDVAQEENSAIAVRKASLPVAAEEQSRPDEKSSVIPPATCFLRKSVGPCRSHHRRWYFDGTTGTCVWFWYGGCGGNENNFASEHNCVRTCGNEPLPMFEQGLETQNTPPVPVSIKPGRSEVYAQVGKMVRLACMAEGSPKPTVTWRRHGKQLNTVEGRVEILEDNSLILSKISSEDAGGYECIASNGIGQDQRWKVNLVAKDRVLISETPTDITIAEGHPTAIRCRIQDDVLFVTWYKDGEKVHSGEFYNVQPWGDLHILDVGEGDGGTYTCTAYATDAVQSASAVLTVTSEESAAPARRQETNSSRPKEKGKSGDRGVDATAQCRDYPEYANCNIVVQRRMCHKHDYARYCCASCGGRSSRPVVVNSRRYSGGR